MSWLICAVLCFIIVMQALTMSQMSERLRIQEGTIESQSQAIESLRGALDNLMESTSRLTSDPS